MSTSIRIIKNTGFLYIKMGINVFISLYSTRLILSSLGASDFGVFNIVGGAITMLGFLNSTMANATQRFMSYAEGEDNLDKKKKVFNVSMILHMIVAFITGLILFGAMFPLFDNVFNILPERVLAAKVIYISLIISTIFTILNVPYDAVMNAHENMLFYSFIGVFEAILKLLVAFVCVFSSFDKLIVYGVLMAFIPFVTLSIMKIYCHRKYDECVLSFCKFWDSRLIKNITFFSSWNFLTAISSLISVYGGSLVLNHFFGTILNAAQGIANQINGQMSSFSLNLMKAVNPVIVKRAGAGDMIAMNKATLAGCKFSTLLLILFAIPFVLEMPYILKIWLKQVPDWTVLFCCLQIIVSVICQTASSAATAIYAQGNIKWYTIYKSIMNLVPIIITYISYTLGGGPYWLYVSMIIVWALGGNVVIVYYANKLCEMSVKSFFIEVILPICIVCFVMLCGGLIIKLFIKEGGVRLVLCFLMTTLLFGLSIWKVVLSLEEKCILKNLLKNRVNFCVKKVKS